MPHARRSSSHVAAAAHVVTVPGAAAGGAVAAARISSLGSGTESARDALNEMYRVLPPHCGKQASRALHQCSAV